MYRKKSFVSKTFSISQDCFLNQRMEMPYSPMQKPRDRETKLHTKPDRKFSVYSDGLGNEVLAAAIS